MTSTLEPLKSVQADLAEGECVIAFRLDVPWFGPWPARNFIGTTLLVRLLETAVHDECISARVGAGGEFNRMLGSITCREREAVVRIVKGLFDRISVSDFAQIAWWDASEGAWRFVHGTPIENFMSPEMLTAAAREMEDVSAQGERIAELVMKANPKAE